MKRILSFLLALCMVVPLFAQRGEINIPDLKGYVTLKCDFHMHTLFSDGQVWPTVRVDEAYREGLDAIAITDHIWGRHYKKEIVFTSHNRSYEIAEPTAELREIILIRGGEITKKMPPGHHNAIFLTNTDELHKPDYMDVFHAAKAQNAFIFWNHPGWASQQPDTTLWWPEHTQLLEQGMMHGIEVVNGNAYYPEAHGWCIEKSLTMLGNTDIHRPRYPEEPRRTMTLVFAREKTIEAIHEAMRERRTAVYWNDHIIGEEKYLKELFENAVEIKVTKSDNTAKIRFKNKSDLVFHLRKGGHDPRLTYLRNVFPPYTIHPNETRTVTVRLNDGIEGGDVNFIIDNFLAEPSKGMRYTVKIE